MEVVIQIVGVACLSAIFTTLSGFIPWAEWYWTIKIPKPFNCELCMGWWLGLVYCYYIYRHILLSIIFAGITSVVSYFIVKYAQR